MFAAYFCILAMYLVVTFVVGRRHLSHIFFMLKTTMANSCATTQNASAHVQDKCVEVSTMDVYNSEYKHCCVLCFMMM